VEVDYYTDAVEESDIKVITTDICESVKSERHPETSAMRYFGEVAVSTWFQV
jgi:hypothetical protein